MSGTIKGSAYQRRRKQMLANTSICGICGEVTCPHCHGTRCPGNVHHIDHDTPRSKGGAVSGANERAAHQCCNLKRGNRTEPPEILRTSRNW